MKLDSEGAGHFLGDGNILVPWAPGKGQLEIHSQVAQHHRKQTRINAASQVEAHLFSLNGASEGGKALFESTCWRDAQVA